jgi:undecaprenyl-diphosphatase
MQLELWKIIVLAVLQGATEFLPVSSSGHLVIVAALLTPDGDTAGLDVSDLNIVLHGGTLIAILVYYWQRVLRLLNEDRRTIGLLVAGTLPAVAAGLPLKWYGEQLLSDPLLAGALLPVTGIILLLVRRAPRGELKYEELTYGRTVVIGISQALAILPGLSRSGTTISTGIRLGLTPESAATFSFLLAIPAIGGACVLEIIGGISGAGRQTPLLHLAIGAGVSFAVGLVCLVWLLRWIERGMLYVFAWWCIPVGVGVVIWQICVH